MAKQIFDTYYGDYHFEDKQGNWQCECVRFRINGNKRYKGCYKDNKRHESFTYYKKNNEIHYIKYYWNGENISRKEYIQNVLNELKM